MEEFAAQVGSLVEINTIESLSEARKMLMENCNRFGPEYKERFLDESSRIHTLIMEKMEEQYDFSVKDIDLGDIPSFTI